MVVIVVVIMSLLKIITSVVIVRIALMFLMIMVALLMMEFTMVMFRLIIMASALKIKVHFSTIPVSVTPKGREILFRGGNLRGSFRLYNIHFHWSNTDNAGSEHTQEGRGFSAEVRLRT